MPKTIEPDKQSVETCLKQKSYTIDFYQREYVWSKETAETLLDDIFYAFELSYAKFKESEISEKTLEKYNWYYLNVYITNNIEGIKYIVDGQQRLSTLTLIATKLYHLLSKYNELKELQETIKQCIFSHNGFKSIFNIDNDKRYNVMDCIFHNKPYPTEYKNKTEQTLIERYEDIAKYLDTKLKDIESKKLQIFVLYFLKRLVLVELVIDQNDTPMIFEVINDRGEALKPFEILKGKLIGALDKNDTEIFCEKWDNALNLLSKWEWVDEFFVDLIKSKFVFKRNSDLEKAINNSYHRYIFEDNEIAKNLGFRKQDEKHKSNIKDFIEKDISYYAKLYATIASSENEFLKYSNENGLSGQYQIILAACKVNDEQESEKIQIIAKEYDRLWMLLNLNGIYDSNEFQEISYSLNYKLKEATLEDYPSIFDNLLKETFKVKRGLEKIDSLLEYPSFLERNYSNMNVRILRYLFARVEKYLCDNINQKAQHDVLYITTKTGDKTGYHIEHILSHNATNISYFESEEEFERERNKLGGLLILKDKVNISSNNEEYRNKLKTYSNGLVWGHTLCEDFYHRTNKDFLSLNEKIFSDSFKPYKIFDKNALNERSKLLYEIVKIIWEVER
ncbi:MAG: DUF262 domain-containing protein [Helicobacteraceae bacterium]|nr:DUF262 domain-containing protein [Helicobacteraceae bacterium]